LPPAEAAGTSRMTVEALALTGPTVCPFK